MNVDKIIVRAVLSTLAAIGVLLVFMISALCLIYPSTMARMTYDFGMESSSIHFSERVYKTTHDVEYIAFATDVAIEDGNGKKIRSCGEKLIQDENFQTFCQGRAEKYEQFIYSKVCQETYKQGDADEAIELAFSGLHGGFPEGNGVISLLMLSKASEDTQTVDSIVEKLRALSVEGEDSARLLATLELVNN